MNISDSELDLVSFASRIEQIEEEQNLRRQNITWLKRYFDEIKQEFNNRPELEQIQTMQEALAHLTAQVAELQQHLNQPPNLSNGLNNNDAYMWRGKLIKADFSNANLSQVKLIEANLEGANLEGTDLQHSYYDLSTIFPTGFDPVKAGAYLITPGASLVIL